MCAGSHERERRERREYLVVKLKNKANTEVGRRRLCCYLQLRSREHLQAYSGKRSHTWSNPLEEAELQSLTQGHNYVYMYLDSFVKVE